MSEDLQQNLRFLCAEKTSIAQVCRDIGLNQQQFSKYLSGRARPSAHNMRRIAQYFDLQEDLIAGTHAQLREVYRLKAATLAQRRKDPLINSFPGDLSRLRSYLGAYQVFFQSPAAPDGIVVNAIFLDERNGIVHSRLIEALRDDTVASRRWTRCDGKASYHGGQIFVVDTERRSESALSMYIMTPPHRRNTQYLFGTMCFLASLPQRTPHASKVVWKKFDTYRSVRELFDTCGVYPAGSLKLDPVTRKHLSSTFES